jgi:hypothetical protein
MPWTTKLLVSKPNQAILFKITGEPDGDMIWFLFVLHPTAFWEDFFKKALKA